MTVWEFGIIWAVGTVIALLWVISGTLNEIRKKLSEK